MPVPPEKEPLPSVTPPTGKMTVWQRIVQRYYWMSLWNRIALWAFLATIIITISSFQYVLPLYRHYKSRMYLRMADQFVVQQDYNAASLAFRKAILSGNQDPVVWKQVGAFLEKIESPEIAKIWETLSELEPNVADHKVRQAEAMLKYGRSFQAEEILNKLPPAARDSVGYHRVASKMALAKRDYQAARDHFAAWLQLEPDNTTVEFQKTVAEMYLSDPLVAYPAKDQIEILAKSGGDRSLQAWRELIARSLQEQDYYDASRLANRLVDQSGATFEDMATYLTLEIATSSFSLPSALERFLAYAKDDPKQLPKVANFLLERGQLQALSEWMKTLPDEVIQDPDVQITRFQVALASQDWPTAFALLRENRLPTQVPPEAVALVEKAFKERSEKNKEADQTWQRAIYMTQGNGGALQILSLLAEANGWTFATGRTLAALANLSSGNLDIWRRLARHEAMTGNLAGYHSALAGMMRINPFDISVSSDWVLSCVLLRKDNPEAVLEVAERAYGSTYPANPSAATAYAVALLGTNRAPKALEVISALSAIDQQSKDRAIYIGAILAANGKMEKALEYLERSGGIDQLKFSEEMGFRRIWEGIARGEESASDQLDRILSQSATWREEGERIALDVRREIEVRYDPVESRRILEELKNQNARRQQSPAELQKLLRDVQGPTSSSPTPQVP